MGEFISPVSHDCPTTRRVPWTWFRLHAIEYILALSHAEGCCSPGVRIKPVLSRYLPLAKGTHKHHSGPLYSPRTEV